MAKKCDIEINKSDGSIWQAFTVAKDLDWFILYKNTHPIKLTEQQRAELLLVNRAKDLKWIWIYTDSWVLISFEETYFILKDYIIQYSLQDNFMWLFKMLYWDTPEWEIKFKNLQADIRDRVDKFFHIIENSKTKETVQEYFFRLIRLVRDDEYNDIKLFLALFPTARDVVKYKWNFEAFFKVDLTNPEDFLRIRRFLSKKAGIYEVIPEFRIGKRNAWQSVTSHTYYADMPEEIKKYYFEQKFYLPDWITVTDISKKWEEKVLWPWDYIYVTNEDFLKFSEEDQQKLYIAIFEDYKLAEPNNAEKLEQSIMKSVENFSKIHSMWTLISWAEFFHKWITNPILYSWMMSLYWFWTWYVSLLALNSFLHLPRYLASKIKWLKFNWDFWNFCETLWIFSSDVRFWKIIKEWFKEWEYKNWFLHLMLAAKRQMTKLAEAQFFNVADTVMTSYYRRNLVEEYISVKYPFIKSFDEYAWQLTFMSKKDREEEIQRLVKYVDDKMYTRFNNSADSNRYIEPWLIVPEEINIKWFWTKIRLWKNTRDVTQEIVNLWSSMWHFYRRYMESYTKSVIWSIKEWWKNWDSQKQVRELMEQFYNWDKEWAEVSDIIDETFWNNQDLEFLINTILYSSLLANMIFKYDIHWNWYDEEYVDNSVLMSEYSDLFKLMFFPLEAWQRTTLWMFVISTLDAVTLDASLEDNINLIWTYNYKTTVKQLAKSQWLLRWITKLVSDVYNNWKYDWAELSWSERIKRWWNDLTSAIHWFWYYLKDDIERWWFEQYTPKTQTPWLKEIFWIREYSTKMFDEINKKWWILEVWDWWDFFSNYFVYNTPFLSEYKIWWFSSTERFQRASKELYNSQLYHSIAEWELPSNVTDDEYYIFYNMMTKYNPRSLDQIWLDFLVDWSWQNDDWTEWHDYNKEAVENIWHDLMIEHVDKDLLKSAVRLFTTADKSYQWQALSALMYLEADTPWAWQKLLWYLANYELMQNVYFSWKYWYFRKQEDWTYSLEDEIRRQQAMRQESINIAKKYFNYEYMLDKEIWAQGALKLFKDSGLSISEYIKDTNANWSAKLWIYTEPINVLEEKLRNWDIDSMYTSNEAMETFLLQLYSNIAMAEWNPDWFKINNFATKLVSTTWRKWKDWKLTRDWAKSLLYSLNAANEMIDNMWGSDVEKVVMKAWLILPHDQIIKTAMEWMSKEEIDNDPVIQYSLRFLRWTARDIDKLADRAISETVQKEQVWVDPSEVSLSRATNSNWKKKSWYSNWKQYYNRHQYLYDQVKYMTSKYSKYYNYLYTPRKTNAGSYYSKRERDLKAFWPALATIRWSWGSRRRDYKQQKPGWSLTQERWKARPFTNRWDLDKIPDRRTKPRNRRTRAYAVGAKLWNKLIPWRRRYIKARQRDIPLIS